MALKPVYTDSQIIGQLDSGYHWSGTAWTFAFPTDTAWFPYANSEKEGFSTLNTTQRAAATYAIRLWDDLIIPDFAQSSNAATANVKVSNTTTAIGYAHAYYPTSTWPEGGSVWFNPTYGANSGTNNLVSPVIGSWGFIAYIHELGHAIGLDHPGTYNGGSPTYAIDALFAQDSQQYTVMSYFTANNTGADWWASNGVWYYPQTPMVDDIMAIQAMYGVETTTRTGDTTYGFNATADVSTTLYNGIAVFNFVTNPHPVVSVFDSAGTDTLDFSGWNTPSRIDLNPGAFSNADMMTTNISIARTAWIENAVGGGGADVLIGNVLANVLTGNGGNDSFTGGGGNDTILGGLGTDTASFSGAFANYSISWNVTLGAYVLVDTRGGAPDGTDTVTDVESFVFSDGARTAASLLTASTSSYAISPLAASASEATGLLSFTVTRTGDLSAASTVSWAAAGSGASPVTGVDFVGGVFPGAVLNFAAGQASQTIILNVANDTVVESDEGVTVTLSNPAAGASLGTASAAGTILNDDALPPSIAIAATDASKAEGNGGTTIFTFTITRSGDISAAGTVNWAVGTGTATAADFANDVLQSGTVSFGIGQASQTIAVNIAGEGVVEANESFTVNLSTPSGGATLGTSSATGTILNDDSSYAIAALDAVKAEGNSGSTAYTFTVTRTGDLSAASTVSWAATGSGASPVNGADFVGGILPGAVLNFGIGQASQTITLNVANDIVVEPDEGITVTLSNPAAGASLTAASASGTILNDDVPPPVISIAATAGAKAEGNAGTTIFTFTATRGGDINVAGTVGWQVAGAGAGAADFLGGVLPGGVLTFAAGTASQVITVSVNADTVYEANEGFTVTLVNPSLGFVLGTASATGTIINDDAATIYVGTVDNDVFNAAANVVSTVFDLSQGGNDTATGGAAADSFILGAALTAADSINGGSGSDSLSLTGNYAAGLLLGLASLTNIERITLGAGFSYNLTTNNATVAAGATLTVDATALASVDAATVNGAAELNGSILFLGGAGNDWFTGGSGADIFRGGLGVDILAGGAGADIFTYASAAESPLTISSERVSVTGDDQLTSFAVGSDRIDLSAFGFAGAGATVLTRSISGFTSAVGTGVGFFNGAGVVVEYARSNQTARLYADINHNNTLDSGDLLIQLTGVARGSITAANITF